MLGVIVCGSRDWRDVPAIWRRLDALESDPGLAVVVEGRQRGADRIAGAWAAKTRARGVGWVPFYADWERHGKAAGPIRNQEMLDWLTAPGGGFEPFCLAFPLPSSVGTWDMVRRCKDAGVRGLAVRG